MGPTSKKTKAKAKQKESEGTAEAWEMISQMEKKIYFFSLYSFSDLRKSDRRISSGLA